MPAAGAIQLITVLVLPGLKYGDFAACCTPAASKMRRLVYRLAALTMFSASSSPAPISTRIRSTSSAAVIAPLTLTWLSWLSALFSAVAIVSPTSVAGLSAAWLVTPTVVRSTLAPPAVLTVITPVAMPAGTTTVTSCWSGLLPSPSTRVRTVKLPTVRPSMLMTRSSRVSPVPCSTMVLPVATAPPTAFSVGTTCRLKPALLPSTTTCPVLASAGTTTLSVVPPAPALPVRVSVPSLPVSSMPRNCTSVLLLKPCPLSTMVWPVVADGCAPSCAAPSVVLAVMPVYTAMGCTPKSTLASSSNPPSVATRIGPSRLRGATMPSRLLLAPSMSIGLSLVARSCCTTPPTVTVVAPSMKPEPFR